MQFNFAALILLVSLLVSSHAQAAIEEGSQDGCESGSSLQQDECTAAKLLIANQEMNTVYQTMKQRLDKIGLAGTFGAAEAQQQSVRLVKAQRAWLPFRDAECALHAASFLTGAGEASVVIQCQLEKTRARLQVLIDLGF